MAKGSYPLVWGRSSLHASLQVQSAKSGKFLFYQNASFMQNLLCAVRGETKVPSGSLLKIPESYFFSLNYQFVLTDNKCVGRFAVNSEAASFDPSIILLLIHC